MYKKLKKMPKAIGNIVTGSVMLGAGAKAAAATSQGTGINTMQGITQMSNMMGPMAGVYGGGMLMSMAQDLVPRKRKLIRYKKKR